MDLVQSSSSSFSYGFTYDVFLNFRGTDTRFGFTGNLYKALCDRGIRAFIDDKDLPRGNNITPSLVKAIEESRIFILVFSLNYASSSFCLDELVHIMHCFTEKSCMVLPVFYGVEPSQVRHQTGSYGEAITNHEDKFQNNKEKYDHNLEKLHKWKAALNQAASLSGYHWRNEYEYNIIGMIVDEVSNKINPIPLHVADYPVGLKSQLLKVNLLVDVGSDDGVITVKVHPTGGKTFFSHIQNFLPSLGWRRLEMQFRGRDVEKWMSDRRLPEDLKRRVRQAELYSWRETRGVPEKMVLESLPEDLQKDIRRHLFKFVRRVPIFSMMDEDEPILDAFRERLILTTYIKESRILSHGGLIHKMVFIVHGKIESIGEDGIPFRLCEGDTCGEELLGWYLKQFSECKEGKKVKLQGQGLTSDRTVTCLTNVEAFSLHAKDIEEVTSLFARFLRSPRVQGVIRYVSPYWRSVAVNRIQVAWRRYRKKHLSRANTTQNDYETLNSYSMYCM